MTKYYSCNANLLKIRVSSPNIHEKIVMFFIFTYIISFNFSHRFAVHNVRREYSVVDIKRKTFKQYFSFKY